MSDEPKISVETSTVIGIKGDTVQSEISMKKRELDKWEIDNPHKMAKMVCALDRNDPHFELKVANLFKGFSHQEMAREASAAIWRTKYFCKSKEDFDKFFEDRMSKHGPVAANWFTPETNDWKLKHFYQSYHKSAPKECTPIDTPNGPYEKECRCWEIKE